MRAGRRGPPQGDGGAKTLQTADLEVKINPRLEWPQMFRDAWRIQREMFYDPGLHGVNLSDVMGRYERFLPRLSSRSDLTYLFQEMMGEMTVGHLGAGGGEQPEVRTIQTGLLGADYEVAGNRYRFRRIYNGENWNPTLRAPLTEPGVNVAAGEYLLAVDGRDVTHRRQRLQLLRSQGRQAGRAAGRTQRQRRRRARRSSWCRCHQSRACARSRGSKTTGGR